MALTQKELLRRYHRKLGQKGGRARADALTSSRRSEIARGAANARWAKLIKEAK